MAQQVMTEVHDFTGFTNGATITWGSQSGDDLNSDWDKVTLMSINGRQYYSWVDGKPRFSLGRASDWQYWDNGLQMTQENSKTFFINRLDAGDKVTIEYRTQQHLRMISGNTSIASNANITSGQEFTVNSAGGVEIECSDRWTVIYKVTIKTQHQAEYEIVGQTFKLISGGVLSEKSNAVPYMTMTFGNLSEPTYVRCFGEGKFGSATTVTSMDQVQQHTQKQGDQTITVYDNAAQQSLMGTDATVFKGTSFSDYEPWHGTYYYFYPKTNGKLTIHFHATAPTWNQQGTTSDPIFLFDRTNSAPATSAIEFTQEGEGEFASVKVLKDHVYYMCTTPLDLRKRNVAYLYDYTFIPDFELKPLYAYKENGWSPQDLSEEERAVATLEYAENLDGIQCEVVKTLGRIASATAAVRNGKLYIDNITYDSGDKVNKGGVVCVEVECTEGKATFVLTVAYSAENLDGTGKEVKRWEFFANELKIGKYSDQNSLLYQETTQTDPDWQNTYMNLHDNTEPIFKSKYDMEGDNADMLEETEGLIILAQSNKLGIYNENDLGGDRYIGIMPTSKLIIPKLKGGDRVRIHMGRYGQTDAHLTIVNGKDVNFSNGVENGKLIEDDYVIGGTHIKNKKLEGVYNFVVDHDGDFELTFKEGGLLKFYDIKIYRAEECEQDNAVRVNGSDSAYEWLFTDQDATDATKRLTYNLHKRGLGEPIELLLVDNVRGNLSLTKDNFTHVGSDADHPDYYLSFYTDVKKGDFGSFRTVVGCETQDHKYVTDYASRNMAVGYRETQEYPYTWDFTDLYIPDYAGDAIQTDVIDPAETSPNENKGWETYSTGWALRNCPNNKWGIYFASGGQLYAGNKMFAETAGLGFKRSTDDAEKMHELNKTVRVVIGGLELNNANSEEFHKIVIPQVDNGAVIYVRATPNTSSTTFAKAMCSVDGTNGKAFDKQFAVGNDEVYILENKDSKKDIELWLNSVTIKKIAVSKDFKTVNDLGYASESRDREIDPELMGFMTGTGLKAYTVTNVSYGDKAGDVPSIMLEAVDKAYVIGAATTGDHNAYIIYNTDAAKEGSKAVKAINNGFHLFVPDMHDKSEVNEKKSKLDVGGNSLVSWLTSGKVPQTEGAYTNYLMNSKGYNEITGEPVEGEEAFYRASKSNSLGANKAYLQLLTEKVKPSSGKPATAKMAIVFVDEENGTQTTSIDGVDSREDISGSSEYYTLSGVKVNVPAKGGIYIKGGKKVIVK